MRKQLDWQSKQREIPSLQIVFAWRNTPKHRFLYQLAKLIYRHHLSIRHVNATYVDPYGPQSILIMSLGLHGMNGKSAWEEADLEDFLRELVMLKYFPDMDSIERVFVQHHLIRGNLGNFLRAAIHFIHQTLVHIDPYIYTLANIEEGFCRHPELIIQVCNIFELKFHPEQHNTKKYTQEKEKFLLLVDHLDTGSESKDQRHKNILNQVIYFIDFCLKTNFYRNNKSSLSFRLNPQYLDFAPYDRKQLFPELPYAVFFIKGMCFIGFHIRFRDLARGGLRTVFPQHHDQMLSEQNYVFIECYNLAYTQQKKNKDIPEGGSKAVLFIEPHNRLRSEMEIYRKELLLAGKDKQSIDVILQQFQKEQKSEYLYQIQRAFIHSLVTLVNCYEDGTLRAKNIIDYWKKPEYLYLGPDEKMHNDVIEWIANYSKNVGYKPGVAFISSKPSIGINHKEYGITSFGVNVYMREMLKYLHIDPEQDPFTVKISGGPDGDVAGNQILNLHAYFPKTAKLLAITDVSGTIFDPEGLDLPSLVQLFKEEKPIAFYPAKKLSNYGYLLDLQTKKAETAYAQKTLCYRKVKGSLKEDWLSGSEMNHLYRHSLHQVKADIFIPAGGRPRTLHKNNYTEFLDSNGEPTSRAIIEGANLYLTPSARRALEDLGVLIIKDSSANKGGVICSSMEVLAGLTMTGEEFLADKEELMQQILQIIEEKARDEAELLLHTHSATKAYLTDISDEISKRINAYTYELLDYLGMALFPTYPDDPLVKALLNFCPPILVEKYRNKILENIPIMHKKAIIACYLASRLVYKKSLNWSPSVIDVLPLIATDPLINPAKKTT